MLLTFCRSSCSRVCTLTVLGTESTACSVRVAVMVVGVSGTAFPARAREGLSNSRARQGRRAKGGESGMWDSLGRAGGE